MPRDVRAPGEVIRGAGSRRGRGREVRSRRSRPRSARRAREHRAHEHQFWLIFAAFGTSSRETRYRYTAAALAALRAHHGQDAILDDAATLRAALRGANCSGFVKYVAERNPPSRPVLRDAAARSPPHAAKSSTTGRRRAGTSPRKYGPRGPRSAGTSPRRPSARYEAAGTSTSSPRSTPCLSGRLPSRRPRARTPRASRWSKRRSRRARPRASSCYGRAGPTRNGGRANLREMMMMM